MTLTSDLLAQHRLMIERVPEGNASFSGCAVVED